MRRKTTILDVLRAGDAKSSKGRSTPTTTGRKGRERRSAGLSQFESWMRAPSALPRFVWLLVLVVGGVMLGGTYVLGHQRGTRSANEQFADGGTRPRRSTQPERMNRQAPNSDVGTASAEVGRRAGTPAPRTSAGPQGFRIETYNATPRNRALRDNLLRHLRAELSDSDARPVTLTLDQSGKKQWIVAVLFPADRRGDSAYQEALWRRLTALPNPDARDVQIDFAKLQRSVIRGRISSR